MINKDSLAIILIYISITGLFASDKELSVEDSLLPVFGRNSNFEINNKKVFNDSMIHPPLKATAWFPYKLLNPESILYLRYIIEKQDKKITWKMKANALFCLGMVGSIIDIEFVDGYHGSIIEENHKHNLLYGLHPEVDVFLSQVNTACAIAIACFCNRSMRRAQSKMKKYLQYSQYKIMFDHWEKKGYTFDDQEKYSHWIDFIAAMSAYSDEEVMKSFLYNKKTNALIPPHEKKRFEIIKKSDLLEIDYGYDLIRITEMKALPAYRKEWGKQINELIKFCHKDELFIKIKKQYEEQLEFIKKRRLFEERKKQKNK